MAFVESSGAGRLYVGVIVVGAGAKQAAKADERPCGPKAG